MMLSWSEEKSWLPRGVGKGRGMGRRRDFDARKPVQEMTRRSLSRQALGKRIISGE